MPVSSLAEHNHNPAVEESKKRCVQVLSPLSTEKAGMNLRTNKHPASQIKIFFSLLKLSGFLRIPYPVFYNVIFYFKK